MASKIVSLLPQHTFYGEPYCGSCAVMLKKGLPDVKNADKYIEAINDKSNQLITMYRYLKQNPNEFLAEIDNILYSKTEHDRAAEVWRNPEAYTAKEIAVAFYVHHNQAFSGATNGGWGRSNSVNMGSVWNNRKAKLAKLLHRFEKCQIDCIDALDFIKKYDRQGALFYCDPPYPDTDQRYKNKYNMADFQALIDLAQQCKGSFAISSYGGGVYSDERWLRHEFKASMSNARDKSLNKERTEVLYILDRS